MVEIQANGETFRTTQMIIKFGIGQGSVSVAGAIFFIIYISEFGEEIEGVNYKGTVVSYADDTSSLIIENQWLELKETASEVLSLANSWFSNNNLILNKEKTNVLMFHHIRSGIENRNPSSIKLNNQTYKVDKIE